MKWTLAIAPLLLCSQAQATAIVIEVDRIQATTTQKGDVRSLLDGGQWQGSGTIRIDFSEAGAALRAVNLELCGGSPPLDSAVGVSATFTQAAQLERATQAECKPQLCFTFRETRSPIAK